MLNIKLKGKPYKMSFKALPVKIPVKKSTGGHNVPPVGADRVKAISKPIWLVKCMN